MTWTYNKLKINLFFEKPLTISFARGIITTSSVLEASSVLEGRIDMAKEKSVLYPSVAWSDCEELIKKIDKYNGLVSYDTVARDYGLKNASAKSFAYRLSTARQFGLVKTTGGSVELTDVARKYLYPTDSDIQAEIKAQCFRKPPLYAKLIERFDKRAIPAEITLANILMDSFGIVRTVKDTAARCFILNAEQMGVSTNGVLNCGEIASESTVIDNDCSVTAEATLVELQVRPEQICELEGISNGRHEKEYVQQNYETENGKIAQIIIPKDATQDDLAAISDMLSILIKRRFKTEIT